MASAARASARVSFRASAADRPLKIGEGSRIESVGFIRAVVRYAGQQDKLERRMRFALIAFLAGTLVACGGPSAGETSAVPSLEQIVTDAPKGPLPSSPYPSHVALDLAKKIHRWPKYLRINVEVGIG